MRTRSRALKLDLGAIGADHSRIIDPTPLLSYDDALAVIARLVDVARSRGEVLRSPIVLVGGTALAGWQVRAYSRDVDIYMPEISADAVEVVEHEFRARFGASFRLDVTTGENIWGQILIRDIASSPVLGTIADLELRALRIEDLFLLKLASGRERDTPDLDLLARKTTVDALVDRWNQLTKWHGDRHAILGYADAMVVQLQRLFGAEPAAIIGRLEVTAGAARVAARHVSWQGIRMTGRAEVERAIIDDESMIERVAGLIEHCVDVAEWPEDARGALALALMDDAMPETEHWKTVTLRRHLFGPTGVVPEKFASMCAQSASARRRAEGLRSGLPARVRYRAAAYMLRAA